MIRYDDDPLAGTFAVNLDLTGVCLNVSHFQRA
jgi:hypothetical protein